MRFHVTRASRISDADPEKNGEIAASEFHYGMTKRLKAVRVHFEKLRNTDNIDYWIAFVIEKDYFASASRVNFVSKLYMYQYTV